MAASAMLLLNSFCIIISIIMNPKIIIIKSMIIIMINLVFCIQCCSVSTCIVSTRSMVACVQHTTNPTSQHLDLIAIDAVFFWSIDCDDVLILACAKFTFLPAGKGRRHNKMSPTHVSKFPHPSNVFTLTLLKIP